LKLFQEWGRGIKENGGGVNSAIQLYIVRTFVNVTIFPQYNNNNNKWEKEFKRNLLKSF
jgi:hypothetical protein